MAEDPAPLVSVITPCLDPGGRLRRCLESVARQTHPRVEHVVVDGGSTDGTVDLLRRTPSVRWVSEPDTGQASAINKGLAMAAGSVVTWLNADDVLVPRAAELAVGVVGAGAEWVYGNLEVRWDGRRRIRRPPRRLTDGAFRARNPVPQPGTFFTARAIHAVGGVDESLRLAMDFDLWLRFHAAGIRSRYVPEVMASFEIHPGSKTGGTDLAEFWDEMARALDRHGRPEDARLARTRGSWRRELGPIEAALRDRRWDEARRLARRAASRRDLPAEPRTRLFLLTTVASPPVARAAVALARRPVTGPVSG